MTYEEALKYASDICFCAGCDINRRPNDSCDDCEHRQFFELVKTLIRKQIPRKPRLEGDGYWDGELVMDTWECLNCGGKYDLECEADALDYCPSCGQAIDWS